MPIERNLQAKGRMAAHFDGEMSPLRVDNVEMVVIDQRPVFGPAQHHFAGVIVFGLPDQGRSFGDENGKDPSELGIDGAKCFGLGVLGFVADIKVAQRNFMFAGIGMDAPGKVPRQLAQSLLVQLRVGKEPVPPGQKATAGLAQREVAAQGNAIRAVVGPAKPVRHVGREVVRSCHAPRLSKPAVRQQGEPLFPSAVWEKACIAMFKSSLRMRKLSDDP